MQRQAVVTGAFARRQRAMLAEWFACQFMRAFRNGVCLAWFEIRELLHQAGWPGDANLLHRLCGPQPKDDPLAVLRKESRTRLKPLRLTIGLNPRPDRIAIRFRSPQLKRNRVVRSRAVVLQNSHLRTQAVLENDVRPSVAVEIGDREGAAVVRKIQSAHAREIEVSVASAHVQHVGLAAAPTVLFTNELIQSVPAVLIGGGWLGRHGRSVDDLTPEETHQVRRGCVGQHPTGDEYLCFAVVIQVMPA